MKQQPDTSMAMSNSSRGAVLSSCAPRVLASDSCALETLDHDENYPPHHFEDRSLDHASTLGLVCAGWPTRSHGAGIMGISVSFKSRFVVRDPVSCLDRRLRLARHGHHPDTEAARLGKAVPLVAAPDHRLVSICCGTYRFSARSDIITAFEGWRFSANRTAARHERSECLGRAGSYRRVLRSCPSGGGSRRISYLASRQTERQRATGHGSQTTTPFSVGVFLHIGERPNDRSVLILCRSGAGT